MKVHVVVGERMKRDTTVYRNL